MQLGKIDHVSGRDIPIMVKQFGMPVAGPAFVENLRGKLWIEVVRLLNNM